MRSNQRAYLPPNPWKSLDEAQAKEGQTCSVLEIDLAESELRKKRGRDNLWNNLAPIYNHFMVCHADQLM